MKAIIEFNLPESQAEFYFATRGKDYSLVVWDLWIEVTKRARTLENNSGDQTSEIYFEIAALIEELLQDYNLPLGDPV